MMERWKKDGNHSSPNNKLVQELEGNQENKCPDPNSNKTKINYAKESNKDHKNTLKEEILQVTNNNSIKMILDMANQNVQKTLKFQDNINREFEKAQEQIKDTIETLYKHTLKDLNAYINSNTVVVGDFITPLSSIDRSSKQKINKKMQDLNYTIDQMALQNISSNFYSIYSLFSSPQNLPENRSYPRAQNKPQQI
jgi:hypothetical protein